MWPAQARASCFRSGMYEVKQETMVRRNMHIVEWSLVATRHIPTGTFLGFYSGEFSDHSKRSVYAARLGNFHIYPFPDEDNITQEQRVNRPFANMNEPNLHEFANCCMVVQDFSHGEVENVSQIPNHETARFFRGLACFTCSDVQQGDSLTWYYGPSYDAHREQRGYVAGKQCRNLIDKVEFIPSASQAVLEVTTQVPHTCVIPVFGQKVSERFKLERKKRKRGESSDDSDTNSSGSGHIPKYTPSGSRDERLRRREARLA